MPSYPSEVARFGFKGKYASRWPNEPTEEQRVEAGVSAYVKCGPARQHSLGERPLFRRLVLNLANTHVVHY